MGGLRFVLDQLADATSSFPVFESLVTLGVKGVEFFYEQVFDFSFHDVIELLVAIIFLRDASKSILLTTR